LTGTSRSPAVATAHPSAWATEQRLLALRSLGEGVLRYGLVFLLLLFGAMKFFRFEAEGIQPLVSHSPLLSWMYRVFSLGTTSAIIGTAEIAFALAIAARRLSPLLSALGSLGASVTFLVTLSFLASTPGIFEPSNPAGGFILKDCILLGAALYTAGESLLAARAARPGPA
jgi:reactive chlorine resistance protein C